MTKVTDVDMDTKTVENNPGGLSLKNHFLHMQNSIQKLQDDHRKCENRRRDAEDFMVVHASALDDWSDNRRADTKNERKALVQRMNTTNRYKYYYHTAFHSETLIPTVCQNGESDFQLCYETLINHILPSLLIDVLNANKFIRYFCEKGLWTMVPTIMRWEV